MPFLFLIVRSAPWATRNFTTASMSLSPRPSRLSPTHLKIGDSRLVSSASMWAPRDNRARAFVRLPLRQALWRGVTLRQFLAFTWAPALTSSGMRPRTPAPLLVS